MKWLATIILCLLAFQATAQEPTRGQLLPLVMACQTVPPDDILKKNYNEIPFLDGDTTIIVAPGQTLKGKLRFFLNPGDPKNYTIYFVIGEELYCMVLSGETIAPALNGTPL